MLQFRHAPLLDETFTLPERMAMALDGDAFAIDASHAFFDEPETPLLRATTLVVGGLHERLIAERWTAAWVWGALPRPPAVHTFCVRIEARVQHHGPRTRVVREVVIEESAIRTLGGLRLTAPHRTVLDLARLEPVGDPAADALGHEGRIIATIRELLRLDPAPIDRLASLLPRSATAAVRLRVSDRLAAVAQPDVTR